MDYGKINYDLKYDEFIKDKLYLELKKNNNLPKWVKYCKEGKKICWGVQLFNLYMWDKWRRES